MPRAELINGEAVHVLAGGVVVAGIALQVEEGAWAWQ